MVIAGNAVNAYRIVALIVALALICFQMLTAFGIKERPRKEQKDKLSLKDMFHIFARNDQLVASGLASIFFNITNNILIVFGVNSFIQSTDIRKAEHWYFTLRSCMDLEC